MEDAQAQVMAAVSEAIAEVNELLPNEDKLPDGPEAALADGSGSIESLTLVNLMVTLEQTVERSFGVQISLAEALEAEPPNHPFRSVAALTAHVRSLLDGGADG